MTMNSTPAHLDDEVLSALLDGDIAAGGAEGDSDAAAHLRACDRCTGRQAELAAARAALATAQVEPIDELTRRRLVAAALQATGEAPAVDAAVPLRRARWGSRHPALVGSAAAVVLAVLVGVPFVIGNDGSDNDTTLSARAPQALSEAAGSFLGDLGDLSDRDRLRLRLSGGGTDAGLGYAPQEPGVSPAAGAPSAAPVPGATPADGGFAGSSDAQARTAAPESATADRAATNEKAASTAAPPAQGSRNTATDTFAADDVAARDRADTDACVAALLDGPARGGRLIASGTGTFDGRPAIVAAFELGGGTVAFVADRFGCAVLDRFSI